MLTCIGSFWLFPKRVYAVGYPETDLPRFLTRTRTQGGILRFSRAYTPSRMYAGATLPPGGTQIC